MSVSSSLMGQKLPMFSFGMRCETLLRRVRVLPTSKRGIRSCRPMKRLSRGRKSNVGGSWRGRRLSGSIKTQAI